MIDTARACRRAGFTIAVAALLGCAGAPGPSIPTPVNGFRPEGRVVIGDFSRVLAIASAPDRVTAIAVRGDYLWIGTRSDLVRYLLAR